MGRERERWEEEWVMRVEEESWERKEQKERKKLSQRAIFLSLDFIIRVENGRGRSWKWKRKGRKRDERSDDKTNLKKKKKFEV